MFHSRRLNNHKNNIHERALRIVFTSFEELLKKDRPVAIHQRNLQIPTTEIFKTKNGLNQEIIKKHFRFHKTCKSSPKLTTG